MVTPGLALASATITAPKKDIEWQKGFKTGRALGLMSAYATLLKIAHDHFDQGEITAAAEYRKTAFEFKTNAENLESES